MFNRLLATSATTVAAFALLAAGGAAHAENVPVSAGAGTFNSTAEDGTGAMTSNARSNGAGAPYNEHADQIIMDNYGVIGAGLQVEGGSTYRVTVTLDDAVTEEAATGSATARGFVEVGLYDCCFAGEQTLIRSSKAELPSAPGDVEVEMDVYLANDSYLTANVELHSYASTYVDSTDSATVESSTAATIVDISPVGEPTPPPVVEEPAPTCILFLCF